jgi:hypothetical protein
MARVGAVVDLGGRRICAGCVDQLTSLSPTQPVARDDRKVFWAHVTLGDLAVATALATSEDDTHAIGTVATLVHGPMGVWSERRLTLSSPTAQARHALEAELVRRRDQLRVTDEDREAARRAREEEADDRAMSRAARRKSIARERALERHRNGGYLTPWERDLVNTA